VLCVLAGTYPLMRFLYYYWQGEGDGHVQSLIIGGVMVTVGAQVFVLSLIASALSWNRRMIEELLYRERRRDYADTMRDNAEKDA